MRESPEEVVAAHHAFVDAGAGVVISASYQMSHRGYRAAGRTDADCDADLATSVALARVAQPVPARSSRPRWGPTAPTSRTGPSTRATRT